MYKDPFSIVYENDELIAVNKSSGIAVIGDRWDESKERLDDLLIQRVFKTRKIPDSFRLYTVHRIDRDTSGLVVFAKNAETHKRLSMAFESREVKKKYFAVIHGRPEWKETVCELHLVADGDKKHRTIIDNYRGKKSLTRFKILGSAGNFSIVEAIPETGRTPQIRVHLSGLGHPIVCDSLYSRSGQKLVYLSSFKPSWRGNRYDEKPILSRLGLHAAELSLPDPALELSAPLPKDLKALFQQIAKNGTIQNQVPEDL